MRGRNATLSNIYSPPRFFARALRFRHCEKCAKNSLYPKAQIGPCLTLQPAYSPPAYGCLARMQLFCATRRRLSCGGRSIKGLAA